MCIHCARVCELLLKIMAVLAKVSTLRKQLPSVLVDPCLYYCCTAHQALAALRSLCTEGCVRTARSTCVGVRNVIREFIWTTATLLCARIRTGFYDLYRIRTYRMWQLRIEIKTFDFVNRQCHGAVMESCDCAFCKLVTVSLSIYKPHAWNLLCSCSRLRLQLCSKFKAFGSYNDDAMAISTPMVHKN